MRKISLTTLVRHCDRLLNTRSIADYPGAVNGLQVENSGRIRHIAAAVDASLATVRMAIGAGADLLLVHHGLFWSPSHPWTGRKYELIRELLENDLAVYSSHLPLDLHPVHGNNRCLSQALGLKASVPFFPFKDQLIGLKASTRIRRDVLAGKLRELLGAPATLLAGGPEVCRKIGVVTGGAGAELALAAADGVDTFITGEGPHWTFPLAEDLGINVFYGGHYATETFGVKSLATHLAKKFGIPWTFLDHPSGL